jgi:hypothetical protein
MCRRARALSANAGTIHHLRAAYGYGADMPSQTTKKRVATAVRLPEDLHAELARQADERDVSVNFLVVRAVTKYLENAPDPTGLENAAKSA